MSLDCPPLHISMIMKNNEIWTGTDRVTGTVLGRHLRVNPFISGHESRIMWCPPWPSLKLIILRVWFQVPLIICDTNTVVVCFRMAHVG